MSHSTSETASMLTPSHGHPAVVADEEHRESVKKKVYSTVGVFGDAPSAAETTLPETLSEAKTGIQREIQPGTKWLDKLKTLLQKAS